MRPAQVVAALICAALIHPCFAAGATDAAQSVAGGPASQDAQDAAAKACSGVAKMIPSFFEDDPFIQKACEEAAALLLAFGSSVGAQVHHLARLAPGVPIPGLGSDSIADAPLANGNQVVAWVSATTLYTAVTTPATTGVIQASSLYSVGPTAEHVIAGDFNGDGIYDLAVSDLGNLQNDTGGGVQIFIGKGDGTFTAGASVNAGVTPVPLAAADFNGDGKLDLLAGNVNQNNISLMLGNGDGTFQPPSAIAVPPPAVCPGGLGGCLVSSLVVADFNGDHRPDVAVGLHSSGLVSVLLGNGDGSFQPPVAYPAGLAGGPITYLTAADLNGDGNPDLIAADPNASGISFLFGNGDGTLQAPVEHVTGASPNYFAYLLRNGHPAIVTADAVSGGYNLTPITVAGSTGAPQIHPLPASTGLFPTGIAAADLNGDQLPDIVAADGFLSVLLRAKGAEFGAPVQYNLQSGSSAVAVTTADLNHDSHTDVIAAGSTASQTGTVDVLLGNGDGTLGTQHSYPIGGWVGGAFGSYPSGIVTADFNGDNKPDVAAGFQSASGSATGAGISVLIGKGDGTLNTAVNYSLNGAIALSVITADLNGDAKPDLAAAVTQFSYSTPGSLALLFGKGDGTFQNPVYIQVGSPAGTPVALAAGDFNGDKKLDLAVSLLDPQLNESAVILLGNGDGTFRQLPAIATGASGRAISIADLNGDGNPDLVVADCCGQSESVYLLGNGDGTFASPQHFHSGSSVTAFAVTDWNNTGVAGLAMAQNLGIGLPGAVMAMQSGLNPKISGVYPLGTGSAAGGVTALAPGSLAASYASDLATGTPFTASSLPWPTATPTGTTVSILDSAGKTTPAPIYFASQLQVDYLIPASVATGPATITVTSGDGAVSSGPVTIQTVAPAIFTLNAANLAAAVAVCGTATGNVVEQVYQVIAGAITAAPVNLTGCSAAVLEVYATGIDSLDASQVQATIGGLPAAVQYAGPQGIDAGLDQINLVIPPSLAGKGNVSIAITASGLSANPVNIAIQ